MGYELRIHIGTATPSYNEPLEDEELSFDQKYGRSIIEIASFDLSGCGYDSRIFALKEKAIAAQEDTLAEDGGWQISTGVVVDNDEFNHREDKYGKPIAAIPLGDVLEALKADFEDSKSDYAGAGYRRFDIAVTLIESIMSRFEAHPDGSYPLVALTYGH